MSLGGPGGVEYLPRGKREHPGHRAQREVEQGRGVTLAPGHVVVPVAGRCLRPRVLRDMAERRGGGDPFGAPAVILDTVVRCRKCENCLRSRYQQWRPRMLMEMGLGGRTWFFTGTVRPAERYRMQCEAVQAGVDWSKLTAEQEFSALWKYGVGRETTLFAKRLRKKAESREARLRFILVAEPHHDGFPHVHGLIHEQGAEVPWRFIEAAWRVGFFEASLVKNPRLASWYVGKYLTKFSVARIRASTHYGAWRTAATASPPEGEQ